MVRLTEVGLVPTHRPTGTCGEGTGATAPEHMERHLQDQSGNDGRALTSQKYLCIMHAWVYFCMDTAQTGGVENLTANKHDL